MPKAISLSRNGPTPQLFRHLPLSKGCAVMNNMALNLLAGDFAFLYLSLSLCNVYMDQNLAEQESPAMLQYGVPSHVNDTRRRTVPNIERREKGKKRESEKKKKWRLYNHFFCLSSLQTGEWWGGDDKSFQKF
jgi:hypothetical protein